jgi:hypothetical protein
VTDDHIDPTGRHALFEPAVHAAPDRIAPGVQAEGRAALFSLGPRRRGTAVIECDGCGARSRVGLADLGSRVLGGSVWLPLGRHNHWLRCPACGRRRWCRVGWLE